MKPTILTLNSSCSLSREIEKKNEEREFFSEEKLRRDHYLEDP